MDIQFDMLVTVYKFPREEFLKSIHSKLETQMDMYTEVAYCEDLGVLFQSVEGYYYSTDKFVQDILKMPSEDMSFKEYVDRYKERMNNLHSDAPVLNQNTTPSEFQPNNPFQRLIDAGLNFKIQ